MPDVFLYPGEPSSNDIRLRDPSAPATTNRTLVVATAQQRQSSQIAVLERFRLTAATAQARQASSVVLRERYRLTAVTAQGRQSSAAALAGRFRLTTATAQRSQSSAAAVAIRYRLAVATVQPAQDTAAVMEWHFQPPKEVLGGPWHRRLTSETSPRVPRTPFVLAVATRQASQRTTVVLEVLDPDPDIWGLEADGLLVGSA